MFLRKKATLSGSKKMFVKHKNKIQKTWLFKFFTKILGLYVKGVDTKVVDLLLPKMLPEVQIKRF